MLAITPLALQGRADTRSGPLPGALARQPLQGKIREQRVLAEAAIQEAIGHALHVSTVTSTEGAVAHQPLQGHAREQRVLAEPTTEETIGHGLHVISSTVTSTEGVLA